MKSTCLLILCMAGLAKAQPVFEKSFSPESIGPGSVSLLTFNISNSSATPVTENIGNSSGANFFVRKATRSIDEISDSTTPGYAANFGSVDIEVVGQSGNGYPTAVEASGNGFQLSYTGVNAKTIRVIGRWFATGIRLG